MIFMIINCISNSIEIFVGHRVISNNFLIYRNLTPIKMREHFTDFQSGKNKTSHRICLNPSILQFNHLTLCVFFYSDGVFRTSLTDGTCHTNYFTFGGGII